LEALPSVRSVTYDRAFPSTLRIFVQPEQPLAVVRLGPERWVVSDRGRLIRRVLRSAPVRLPRFRLPAPEKAEPGSLLAAPLAHVVVGALALVPKRFPARINAVRIDEGRLIFSLRAPWGQPELRLGEPVGLEVKLASAALVLRSLNAGERASAAYLDVSIPERVVVGTNPRL
jgi:hypothetical protein